MRRDQEQLNILVTGASGFLGSGIISALAEQRAGNISGLDVTPPTPEQRRHLDRCFTVDVTSAGDVSNVFEDYCPDLVIHTAGIIPARNHRYSTKARDWERVKAINCDGTRHVLDAAMKAGCRRFLYTSSCTVVIDDLDHDYYYMDESIPIGHATLHYGKSKGMAEQYVLSPQHAAKGLLACALRPCTIIGPGETAVVGLMHDLIAKGETSFIVGDGGNIYDFMYISNAVDAHLLAAKNLLSAAPTAAGHAFFISNQEPVYFWDFLAYIWAQFGHYPKYRVRIPSNVAWFFAVMSGWLTWLTGGVPTLHTGSLRDGVRTHFSNNAKAQEILGYQPRVGLAEGVRLACEDYKRVLSKNSGKR